MNKKRFISKVGLHASKSSNGNAVLQFHLQSDKVFMEEETPMRRVMYGIISPRGDIRSTENPNLLMSTLEELSSNFAESAENYQMVRSHLKQLREDILALDDDDTKGFQVDDAVINKCFAMDFLVTQYPSEWTGSDGVTRRNYCAVLQTTKMHQDSKKSSFPELNESPASGNSVSEDPALKAFEHARSLNTVAAYDAFLALHGTSAYAEKATKLRTLAEAVEEDV